MVTAPMLGRVITEAAWLGPKCADNTPPLKGRGLIKLGAEADRQRGPTGQVSPRADLVSVACSLAVDRSLHPLYRDGGPRVTVSFHVRCIDRWTDGAFSERCTPLHYFACNSEV